MTCDEALQKNDNTKQKQPKTETEEWMTLTKITKHQPLDAPSVVSFDNAYDILGEVNWDEGDEDEEFEVTTVTSQEYGQVETPMSTTPYSKAISMHQLFDKDQTSVSLESKASSISESTKKRMINHVLPTVLPVEIPE